MKTATLFAALLLVCGIAATSCNEDDDTFEITEDNLTECEQCEFVYRENARLDGLRLVGGDELVFLYKEYWDTEVSDGGNYSGLFFETTASGSFELGKREMEEGKVVHITMCPNCGVVPLQAVDGYIKGNKRDNGEWLVDAHVVLAYERESEMVVTDTLEFKQYFVPEEVD